MPYDPSMGYANLDPMSMGSPPSAASPLAPVAMPHPAQQLMNQYRNMWPIRSMGMIDRDLFYRSPRAPRGGNPLLGGQPLEGQYDLGSLQNPQFQQAANSMLAPYGLSMPQSVGPNALLPNSGFFGNHPRLSSGLEGAMFGFMNTQGADTWGEGISNAMRGGFGAMGARNDALASRMMQPFSLANHMEQLRDLADKHELNEAMIQWHKAEANKANREPVQKYAFHQVDENGQMWGVRADGSMEALGQAGQFRPPGPNKGIEDKVPSAYIPYFHKHGYTDPDKVTPEQWGGMMREYQRDQERLAGGKAGAGEHARVAAGEEEGVTSTKQDQELENRLKDTVVRKEARDNLLFDHAWQQSHPNGGIPTSNEIDDYIRSNYKPVQPPPTAGPRAQKKSSPMPQASQQGSSKQQDRLKLF